MSAWWCFSRYADQKRTERRIEPTKVESDLYRLKRYANQKQQKRIMDFAGCLETMEYSQAVALIDRYYKDHPELWQQPLPEMLVQALTAPGSPCQGKTLD